MDKVLTLATEFRVAMDRAKQAGEFIHDDVFRQFPHGCCGGASDLLGQYLMDNGIHSRYVCGTHYYGDTSWDSQSHAWVLLDDGRIADITGNQFKYDNRYFNYDKPVYVGKMDAFHELFEVEKRDVHKTVGTQGDARLGRLYRMILKYIICLSAFVSKTAVWFKKQISIGDFWTVTI